MSNENFISHKDEKKIKRLQMMIEEQLLRIERHKKLIQQYIYQIDQIRVKNGAEQTIFQDGNNHNIVEQ